MYNLCLCVRVRVCVCVCACVCKMYVIFTYIYTYIHVCVHTHTHTHTHLTLLRCHGSMVHTDGFHLLQISLYAQGNEPLMNADGAIGASPGTTTHILINEKRVCMQYTCTFCTVELNLAA